MSGKKAPPAREGETPRVEKKTIEIKKEVSNTHIHEVKLNDVENSNTPLAPKRGGGKIAHWVSKAAWGLDLNDWATACGWKFAKRFEKVQLTTEVPAIAHKVGSKCESILKGRDLRHGRYDTGANVELTVQPSRWKEPLRRHWLCQPAWKAGTPAIYKKSTFGDLLEGGWGNHKWSWRDVSRKEEFFEKHEVRL